MYQEIGQGACEETGCVIDEVGDDHFDDLRRDPGDRTRACHRSLRVSTPRAHSPDSG